MGFRKLYAIKARAREFQFTHSQRQTIREKEGKPIWEEFKHWLLDTWKKLTPKHKLNTDIEYILPRWAELGRYLLNGELEIGNSPIKNQIRPVALGRKAIFLPAVTMARSLCIYLTGMKVAKRNKTTKESTMVKTLTLLVFLTFLGAWSSSLLAQMEKDEMLDMYNNMYRATALDSMPWSGSLQTCDPGELNPLVFKKVETRINFFRYCNNLPPIKIDVALNWTAQQAALLTASNKTISHDPPANFRCYSDSAAEACKRSLLAMTDYRYYKASAFITGFIYDYGEYNYYVPHRRWLLYSRLQGIGYGATSTSEAISPRNDHDTTPGKLPDFIAYPWAGYVPQSLIFPRWSFAIPEGNEVSFEKCRIELIDKGGKMFKVKILPIVEDYLDPTITWEVPELFAKGNAVAKSNERLDETRGPRRITVNVIDVKVNGIFRNFQYHVTVF